MKRKFVIDDGCSELVLGWCCGAQSGECAWAVSGRERKETTRSEERECTQNTTALLCFVSLLIRRLARQTVLPFFFSPRAFQLFSLFSLCHCLVARSSPQIILSPALFLHHPKTSKLYNGSYEADGSQVHGRQGPAQAARHQGCPQVGARHRCVFLFCFFRFLSSISYLLLFE